MTASRPSDRLFDGWERAWSGRDPAAFGPLCIDDVHYEDPLTQAPLTGPAAIAKRAQTVWTAFPDVRLNATGPRLSDGRHVSAPAKLMGTHREPLAELEGERLKRIRAFFDAYGAAVTLGVLPRPGTLGEKALLMLRGFGLRSG